MTHADRSHVAIATLDERSHTYVTPAGRVRYAEDALHAPEVTVVEAVEVVDDGIKPEFIARFHAIVEELTDDLMASGDFERATCRADAIALLTAASDRLQKDEPAVESPLNYLLMEERQKASAALDSISVPRPQLTFLKV